MNQYWVTVNFVLLIALVFLASTRMLKNYKLHKLELMKFQISQDILESQRIERNNQMRARRRYRMDERERRDTEYELKRLKELQSKTAKDLEELRKEVEAEETQVPVV